MESPAVGNTLLACIALITCSFIFSASEIALFSLSRIQLKKIKEQSEPLFRKIKKLLQDSIGILITILFFNEIVNITLGSLITKTWVENRSIPEWWVQTGLPVSAFQTILGVLITTPVLMIFCELTPKVVASKMNHFIASIFIPIVYTLYRLLQPLVSVIKIFLPKTQTKEVHQFKEEDLLILMEEQTERGHLHETELELIRNVFELDDLSAERLCTPIKKVISIPSDTTLDQAAQLLLRDRTYSRIPIHGKTRDDIVGVLQTKDLVDLRVRPECKTELVISIAKEPLFISHTTNVEALLRKMKSKKVQVAFVKNGSGKVMGMVTLQDIFEHMIEEVIEDGQEPKSPKSQEKT